MKLVHTHLVQPLLCKSNVNYSIIIVRALYLFIYYYILASLAAHCEIFHNAPVVAFYLTI